MRRTEKIFHSLAVSDVMRPAVEVFPHRMSVMAAARVLLEQQVRAAPVIDTVGRCVGVLEVEDLLPWAADGGRAGEANDAPTAYVWCEWQVVDVPIASWDEVRRHMKPDPLLVPPDTSLADIAESLLEHRPVVVVNEDQQPLGVVSSRDILAALVPVEGRRGTESPELPPAGRRVLLRRLAHPSRRP